jgi:hypothetical protein
LKSKSLKIGFLPCFSNYKFKHFPLENLYFNDAAIKKVKLLMSAFIDSNSTLALREHGIGKEIKPIRPDGEGKKLIMLFGCDYPIYRIDYGDTPFRIIFGLDSSNDKRFAYILAFDMTHRTLPQKKHQRK